ncbi:MAG: DUF5018 domain-containing protein [Bacteroidales bacterium]|nr:DUF5018 domain-containing protein [Bacteroidales bacterium]
MKRTVIIILCLCMAGFACKKSSSPKSGEKRITRFATGTDVWCDGNCGATISKSFCKTATVGVQGASITVSAKATVALKSGTDFFSGEGVVYTVTAEDGTTANYTVKATRTTEQCE